MNTNAKPSVAAQKAFEEFMSEAKTMSKIPPNAHVIQLFGICRSPLCLLTEYVDGKFMQLFFCFLFFVCFVLVFHYFCYLLFIIFVISYVCSFVLS
jgi:hypothetical protein